MYYQGIKVFFMTDIMAFGAHPDDIEFGCGGILAKEAAQGHSIVLVDLTAGEKSTNGTPEQRRQEAMDAAKLIGAKRINLGFKDCEVFDTYEGRLKLVKVIREHKPRLIIAPMWTGGQTHPDHMACGAMARFACRYARFANILPEIPIHKPEGILHYLAALGQQPTFLVDVSAHFDTWTKMMEMHKTQLQTFPYTEWVIKHAAYYGMLIGKPYAQGLVAGNPVVVDDLLSVSRSPREI